MGEGTSVWSGDSSSTNTLSLEDGRSGNLDSLHLSTVRLLLDVLNGKFATWSLDCSKAVRLGPVGRSSLVRNSSIQHI